MGTDDPLAALVAMVKLEQERCSDALSLPRRIEPVFDKLKDDGLLVTYKTPGAKPIAALMANDKFMPLWDAAFRENPYQQADLKCLRKRRWVMLNRTAEFLRTNNSRSYRLAQKQLSEVQLLLFNLDHERDLIARDDSPYVPAQILMTEFKFASSAAFGRYLDRIPETIIRRRKPSTQRLEVHAADFIRYRAEMSRRVADASDHDEATSYKEGKESRQEIERKRKEAAGEKKKFKAR